jgi:hypothetical protein
MSNKGKAYQKRVFLFLQDLQSESFAVYPYIDPLTTRRAKWCLPSAWADRYSDDDLVIAKSLAFDYYSIDIDTDNLVTWHIQSPENLHVVINKKSNPAIDNLFKKVISGGSNHYSSLDLHQTILPDSHFDQKQKALLMQARLLPAPNYDDGRTVVSLDSYRRSDNSKKSLGDFKPKPL